MNRGDPDDIEADKLRDPLDVLRHHLRIADLGSLRVDAALGSLGDNGVDNVAIVSGMAIGGDPAERVVRDRVGVPVVHRNTKLAALVLRMRRLAVVDALHLSNNSDRLAERWQW